MRKICLILIGFMSSFAEAAISRQVVCEGQVSVLRPDNKEWDRGGARMQFQLVDSTTMRNIYVATKFKKTKAQSIEAYESRAVQRAVASGKFRGDLFPLGDNGACQIAIGFQGSMVSAPAQSSLGMLGMNCGTYAISGQMRCQLK